MKTGKKLLTVAIVALLLVSAFAGCGKKSGSNDTLVVGYDPFSAKFSPFFATTAYDVDAAGMTQVTLLGYDREGNIVLNGIEGETRAYNGVDYTYTGIADCAVTQNKDAAGNITSVVYDITMRDDIKFSDGEPVTIDDVIFSMYVYADPTYDGSTTFYSLPIEGMAAYRSGMTPLSQIILEAGPDGTSEYFTAEQSAAYWTAFYAAGEKFAQEIVDYCVAAGYAAEGDVAGAAAAWGYTDLAADATAADFFAAIVATYGYDISDSGINYETAGTSITDYINAELGDNATAYAAGVQTGQSAANIAGIEKTGDYSMKITMTEFDATAVLQLTLQVSPLHYYGSTDAYDYDNNMFGFTKGDLSGIKALTTAPMGAGPYKFVSYENGVISYEANENYWEGAPKTKYVKFQEITVNADKVAGVISGTVDISDPSLSTAIIDAIKEGNSNGELTGNTITYTSVDNNGYGYIGMDATRIKVGDDSASEQSKDLRKALATVIAVYRDTVVNSYYGERATVIQYPITNTSWAAPKSSDEGYEIAYSTDVDGNPIYTADMTEDQKYAAALQAAIGFLKAAGYTWDDATQTFTAAPAGASLQYTAVIPGGGTGDHPSYGIFTNTKEALATIGITLDINDPSDSNELWDGLDADTVDMWAAAWSNSLDPDMYQVYHSSNAGGNKSNHYSVTDSELDKLIVEARASDNNTYRKSIYKECLNIILDWGVEVPVYQRQNCFIFSTARINIDTIPADMTPFWGWINGVNLIEMN